MDSVVGWSQHAYELLSGGAPRTVLAKYHLESTHNSAALMRLCGSNDDLVLIVEIALRAMSLQ